MYCRIKTGNGEMWENGHLEICVDICRNLRLGGSVGNGHLGIREMYCIV